MLSLISWQQYLLAVGIAGFFYYLVVIVRFYRASLSEFRKNREVSAFPDPVIGAAQPDPREVHLPQPDISVNLRDNQSPNLN